MIKYFGGEIINDDNIKYINYYVFVDYLKENIDNKTNIPHV